VYYESMKIQFLMKTFLQTEYYTLFLTIDKLEKVLFICYEFNEARSIRISQKRWDGNRYKFF
jgi:hypothetical protein